MNSNTAQLLTNTNRINFYSKLLQIRPTQLGVLVKQLLQIKRQYMTCLTGHTFWADPVSVFGLPLLRTGIYEPQMTKLLEIVLRPSDTFVDIGGNEGYFSVIASSLVGDGKVHCIEPQSRLYSIIQENIRVNSATSVIVYRLAISNTEGEVKLFLRPSTNTGASSMFPFWKLGFTQETVKSITLDRFFRNNSLERVRLLKVDCEGAEYLVIAGGQEVVKQQLIDFIAMEYHPMNCGIEKCIEIHQKLRLDGYTLTKIAGQCIYHLPGLEHTLQSLGKLHTGCDWNE